MTSAATARTTHPDAALLRQPLHDLVSELESMVTGPFSVPLRRPNSPPKGSRKRISAQVETAISRLFQGLRPILALALWLGSGARTWPPRPSTIASSFNLDPAVDRNDAMRRAEVEVSGDCERAGGTAFGLLAGDLFGDNGSEMRMAMTAPVRQETVDPIGMVHRFSFLMRARLALADRSAPHGPWVQVREQIARVMAVRRYRLGWSQAR
jgi:hypothetical protein